MEKGFKRDRKILVVGAAGGIGSKVCKHLCSKGKDVIAVDNVSTGNLSNIEELYQLQNFEFIRSDIADLPIPGGVGNIIFLGYPDKTNHDSVFNLNIDGLVNCLTYCADNMCSILYGANPIALSPLDGTNKNNAHYLSRQYGEALVSEFYKKYQIGSSVVRIPSVYGDESIGRDQLIWRFFKEASKTGEITVLKDPNSTRSYIHYEDLVAIISEQIGLLHDGKFRVVEAFGPDVLTATEVATCISEEIKVLFGSNSAIIHKGRRYSHKRAVSSMGKSSVKLKPRLRVRNTLGRMFKDKK